MLQAESWSTCFSCLSRPLALAIVDMFPRRRPGRRGRGPYVVRSVGYSLGGAIDGVVLATGTGHLFPNDHAYTTATLVGIVAMAVTALMCARR